MKTAAIVVAVIGLAGNSYSAASGISNASEIAVDLKENQTRLNLTDKLNASATNATHPAQNGSRSKHAKKAKKKRRPQLDVLLDKISNSSDVLAAVVENTNNVFVYTRSMIMMVVMPVWEALLVWSSAAKRSQWGEKASRASHKLQATTSTTFIVPLPQLLAYLTFAGLCGYFASRFLRPRPQFESIHWLEMWWQAHPPNYNTAKLRESLQRQINEYLRSSVKTSSANVAALQMTVVDVQLGDTPLLPTLSNIQVIKETDTRPDRADGATKPHLILEADFDVNSDAHSSLELEMQADNFMVHVLVARLVGRAIFSITDGPQCVASLSFKSVTTCQVEVTSVARISLSPVRSLVRGALRNFLLAPRSMRWKLAGPSSFGTPAHGSSADLAVLDKRMSAGNLLDMAPDPLEGRLTIHVHHAYDLHPEFDTAQPMVVAIAQAPHQRKESSIATDPFNPVFDSAIELAANSRSRVILLQVVDAVPSHKDASLIGEARVLLVDLLNGRLDLQLEHPDYRGAAGVLTVSGSFDRRSDATKSPVQVKSPQSRDAPEHVPSIPRTTHAALSVDLMAEHNQRHKPRVRPPSAIDAASSFMGSEAPSMISQRHRRPNGHSSLLHSANGGSSWQFSEPVELIETTHPYGTHLTVAHPSLAPAPLRRWQAKTRRLKVMCGHAFALVASKPGAICAVSNKPLHKGMRKRKVLQCKYCLMVVDPKLLSQVREMCPASQLPDLTDHGHNDDITVNSSVLSLGLPTREMSSSHVPSEMTSRRPSSPLFATSRDTHHHDGMPAMFASHRSSLQTSGDTPPLSPTIHINDTVSQRTDPSAHGSPAMRRQSYHHLVLPNAEELGRQTDTIFEDLNRANHSQHGSYAGSHHGSHRSSGRRHQQGSSSVSHRGDSSSDRSRASTPANYSNGLRRSSLLSI